MLLTDAGESFVSLIGSFALGLLIQDQARLGKLGKARIPLTYREK